MSEQTPEGNESVTEDPEDRDDQDAGPASRPTGAAAHESPSDDPDAGPASEAPQE
jgi:hypothetical protein